MEVGIDADILLYKSAWALESRGYIGYNDKDEPAYFSKFKKDVKDFPRMESYSSVEVEDLDLVCSIFDGMVGTIIRKTGATSHKLYVTGKGNFRKELYNDYKSSRGPKPLLYSTVREYVEWNPNTIVSEGEEADDLLGIAQCKDVDNHIIASIDKDLLMIEGNHYNINSGEMTYVAPKDGLLSFYKQILTGDKVDDIPGIYGVGPKKADKILDGIEDEEDLWLTVVNKWCEYAQHDSVLETVIRNARLLWIRTKEGEIWQPPIQLMK